MARAYHNLDGFLRDAENAYRSSDAEGQQRWSRLVDVCEWCLEHIEGPAGDADGDDAGDEDEVDGDDEVDGGHDARESRGHAEGGRDHGAPASSLDRALDGLAGPERDQAIRELDELRMHAVARPGGRQLRLSCMPKAAK